MNPQTQDEWEILLRFLPAGWEDKALELGALSRRRKIDSAQTLLRVLLIHLASGKSLRTTAAYAHEAKLCSINDTSLLHRLKVSEEWLHWMCVQILHDMKKPSYPESLGDRFRVRVVDGTSISEPGSTGSDWRIHYCLQLANLRCDTFKITTLKIGEDFQRYDVSQGDLLIADRGYCRRNGITYVVNNGGSVLVRFHSSNLPLFNKEGESFSPLERLRLLKAGECGDWIVYFRSPGNGELKRGRICALKKSEEAAELAKKKLRAKASRQQRSLMPETLEYAEYVIVFTTVTRHQLKAQDILTLYRGRWQIELVFKRLKSIIAVGHLPKHNEESCIAWLYGKMLVALLVERLYLEAESFSPWGYPISCPQQQYSQKAAARK
jgi:hypothetical protein